MILKDWKDMLYYKIIAVGYIKQHWLFVHSNSMHSKSHNKDLYTHIVIRPVENFKDFLNCAFQILNLI